MRKFSEQVKVVQIIMEELEKFQYRSYDDCDSPFEIMGFEIKHVGITFNFVNLGAEDELNVFIPNHILRGSTKQELVEAFLLSLSDYDIFATPRFTDGNSRYDYLDYEQTLLAAKYDEMVNPKEDTEESDDSSECDCDVCEAIEAAKVAYK